jgi:hypothetical protein
LRHLPSNANLQIGVFYFSAPLPSMDLAIGHRRLDGPSGSFHDRNTKQGTPAERAGFAEFLTHLESALLQVLILKGLTATLNPLDAMFTKNRGAGYH